MQSEGIPLMKGKHLLIEQRVRIDLDEGCNQRLSEAIPRMKGKHLIEQRVRIDGLFQLNQHLDLP